MHVAAMELFSHHICEVKSLYIAIAYIYLEKTIFLFYWVFIISLFPLFISVPRVKYIFGFLLLENISTNTSMYMDVCKL